MAKETVEQRLQKAMQKTDSSVAIKPVFKGRKMNFIFSIDALNKALIMGIVACVVALIWQMRCGFILLHKTVELPHEGKIASSLADMDLPAPKAVDYYLTQVNVRNIFKPSDAQAAGKILGGDQNLAKRLSKYKLVGIAWLDLPESASIMLEDSQTKQIYFLKQGEQVDGITVKTIYTGKVVFAYGHEETAIKL